MAEPVTIAPAIALKGRIAAIVAEPGGELLDKILRIGDLVGVARPPRHVSPVVMGPGR